MKKILLLQTLFFCFLQFSFAQQGKPDSSFGTNGIVVGDFGKLYNYGGTAEKILSQPDGSSYTILNVSGKTLIIKLLATGSADVNYGQKGFSGFSDISPTSAVMQPDGKIVVAGNINNDFGVTRFNTNGSIDTSFSSGGIKSFYGARSFSNGVALQADGKIVLAGSTNDIYERNSVIEIEVLNTDGSYDTTFDDDGTQEYWVGEDIRASSIVIQNDNKIVVAVSYYLGLEDFTLLSYNTNGSLDSSFSGDGIQTTSFTDENGNYLPSVISSTIIQPDGKIVATGLFSTNTQNFICLARYNTDGSLDSSFSNDGKQTTNLAAGNGSIAIQDNGKIVVSGSASLSRYNTDGSLDSTFNKNEIQTNYYQIASIVIQNGKKILSAGNTFNKTGDYFVVARFKNNGSPDKTFNNDGKFVSAFKDRNTTYTNTAIQKDKKVISVGSTWNGSNFDFIVSRYTFDGSTDNTFHGNGKQTLDFSSKDDYADAAAIQNDGKIIVAGHSVKNDSSSLSVARYNTDGSLDNTFSGDGLLNIFVADNANTTVSAIIQKDEKILLAGSVLIRLNTDGSPDNTFNHKGILKPPFAAYNAAIQSDGKIVVAGSNGSFLVARFNTNGSIDSSFAENGIQIRKFYDYYDNSSPSVAYSVAIQNDGKIIAGGHCDCQDRFTSYSAAVINRFNTDGSFDNTFSSFDDQGLENSGFVNQLAIQNDGKIIIADIPDNSVDRLNEDGSSDPNFSGLSRDYNISSLKIAGKNLYTTGYTTPVIRGVTARYFYNDSNNTAPVVSITTPTNATFQLGQHIKIKASASDSGGAITKVEFYIDGVEFHTETIAPYGASWKPIYRGNYTLTAIAYDNTGLFTTSAPVHIYIEYNKPPLVSIIKPVNNESFAAPGYIHFEADAEDFDGTIKRVEFYNGSTLLRTEYKYPYTYVWKDVPAGTYTITAVATDNQNAQTTSSPITIRVTSPSAIVSGKPSSKNKKIALNDALSLRLSPNPSTNVVNIQTSGLLQNKPATLSIISISGIVLKTMQISKAVTQLGVSTLASGVYTIKIISGDKVVFKKLVKL